MKQTIKLYLVCWPAEYVEGGIYYTLWTTPPSDGTDVTLLDKIDYECEIPDRVGVVTACVETLNRQKEAINAESYAAKTEIDGKIQSLLAIENHSEVA